MRTAIGIWWPPWWTVTHGRVSRSTAKYAHVVDMAKKNPALFIPVKVG
jgi:hypothetical protein